MNALTHGLTAQTAVLPGEDRGQLEALSTSLMRHLRPTGILQRLVAERIVSLAWKLRRVARAEETIALAMEKAERKRTGRRSRRDGASFLAESIQDKGELPLFQSIDTRLTRLTQYELKLDAALRAAVREMRALQKDPGLEDEEETEPEDESTCQPPTGENEPNSTAAESGGLETTAPESQIDETNPPPTPAGPAETVVVTDLAAETTSPEPQAPASHGTGFVPV